MSQAVLRTGQECIPEAVRFAAQHCDFGPSQVLARQGDVPRSMYFVLAGEVRLVRAGRGGEMVILQRVRRGWVAEASLFSPRYHCDLATGTATTCINVPVRAFRDALAGSPAFAREWIASLSAEVRRLRGVCERMGLRSAEQRVLHAIEAEGADGVLQLPGTVRDWAAELGLTHEALYRTLAKLQASGKLRRQGGNLVLLPRR
jgi:CRP/FNR family transcriptional regulator, dissimilatory nitrate respiration regulator